MADELKDKYKQAAQGMGLGAKQAEEKGKNRPIGVYLNRAERDEIQALADKAGITRHAFLQYSIRHFVAGYKRGKYKFETKTIEVLKPPS